MRNFEKEQQIYKEISAQLKLDKPPFYLTLTAAAYPDTLHRIPVKEHRQTLSKLVAQYGNWIPISAYYTQLQQLESQLRSVPDSLHDANYKKIRNSVSSLYIVYKHEAIRAQLKKLNLGIIQDKSGQLSSILASDIQQLADRYIEIRKQSDRTALYIPAIRWHGLDNQYHHWFINFMTGDFGTSYHDNRPVVSKLLEALRWTLIMNLLALSIAYLISIPLGVHSAVHRGSRFDRWSTIILFMLYSLPSFWIATILIVFLSSPTYGDWLDIFPAVGLGNLRPEAPFWDRFLETAYHLILPVFCMTYATLAFITRQMRGGMIDVLQQDYIRTARAKGLGEQRVIWKHAWRNALFPIITLFASVFPRMLAGSVVLEVIFGIPGMGELSFNSILSRDWPVVYAILMFSAILTMIGILIADLLYAASDPRISLSE